MNEIDINKYEKIFSDIYGFKYTLFKEFTYMWCADADLNAIFNFMKIFDCKITKNRTIYNHFINEKLSKLSINLLHVHAPEDIKYCEASKRFGPKVVFDYINKNIYVPENSISILDIKSICEKIDPCLRDIHQALTMIENPTMKTIKDVVVYFHSIDEIAITNSVFQGYIYKKYVNHQKFAPEGNKPGMVIEIPSHFEIFGHDDKGDYDICYLDDLDSHFNTPVYQDNWSIAGIMINGELYKLDSDDK